MKLTHDAQKIRAAITSDNPNLNDPDLASAYARERERWNRHQSRRRIPSARRANAGGHRGL